MGAVETITILLASSLLLCLLYSIIDFLRKVWFTPLRIQSAMRSQGIRGPPYRFLHGNTKEIFSIRKESITKPMDYLSHHLFPRLLPHVYTWLNAYGKNYLQWYGPRAQLVVHDAEFVKEILNNRDKAYPKSEATDLFKKVFGDGILTSEGEKWAKLRRIANHAFLAESLRNMVPEMVRSVEMMLERWTECEGEEIEVCQEFKVLTSDVISRTAFGSCYLEGINIFEMLSKLSIILRNNFFKIRVPGLSKLFKNADDVEADMLAQKVRDAIVGMVKAREKLMSREADNLGTDFLGLLVRANHDAKEKNRITIEELVDECKIIYIAGQETTATLLTWTVLFLATHTEWQEKAREEVIRVFGQQRPDSEGCGNLKTMSMILNESLRLYPPVLSVSRQVGKEVKLGNINLPAKINLFVPILALHHDPNIWGEDALHFKPERFSEGVAKATNNTPSAFMPFSLGPRSCAGMNFAINEAKIALSMILQRFAFTLSPNYIHAPVQVLTVRPQHGLQIMLHAL